MMIILMIVCGMIAMVGDLIGENFKSFSIGAIFTDNITHALLGGITWMACTIKSSSFSYYGIAICSILSSLIDLDHLIEVRSFRIQDIQLLNRRPFLHCSTLGILASILFILLGRYMNDVRIFYFGWMVFTAIFTHHTRDATRRGYWVYPFGHTVPLPYWLYILVIVILPIVLNYAISLFHPKETLINYKPIHRISVV